MNVSACLVTRGNVDMSPVLESLPLMWEVVIWDNGDGSVVIIPPEANGGYAEPDIAAVADLSVYGRYAAIEYASHDVIYVQDDDVIVSDPQAIVDAWMDESDRSFETAFEYGESTDHEADHFVANMPQEFRHDGYIDSCLVGFGACFHRDLPRQTFARFRAGAFRPMPGWLEDPWFQRTCDVVFTALTPRVLVDVPKVNREFAEDADRMYRQPGHVAERARMLELVRRARDA